MGEIKLEPPLDELYNYLPHGAALRLIHKIDEVRSDGLSARAYFGGIPSCRVAGKGSSLFSGIEYVAQASALFHVIRKISQETDVPVNNLGYIIAIRNMEILDTGLYFLEDGRSVTVDISSSDKIGNVYRSEGGLFLEDGRKILTVVLTLYEV